MVIGATPTAASETSDDSSLVAKRLGQRSVTPIKYLERREVGLVNDGLGPSEIGDNDSVRVEAATVRGLEVRVSPREPLLFVKKGIGMESGGFPPLCK
ncbi:hypothetical protein V6N12_013750 [Hibiscus sabdariffa]|uniref:Uncharacterized protein n=1 Tax=Hibiscus sabdariffa TaxID=183260 RepID=A0ABR2CWV5_9ROSI